MKTLKVFVFMILVILASSCTKDLVINQPDQTTDQENSLKSAMPHLKIAVMSDIHFLDPTLMMNGAAQGTAFQSYLIPDPKLIEFSGPILIKAISEIVAAKPDILLIPGDLTKDGEEVGHQSVAKLLKQISDQGIKVFVVPGNHDINNPEAVAYDGNNSSPVASISADDFANIYSDFGYNNAISRDDNSLSYVCQPFNKIWILGIDDCKYYLNEKLAIVGGVIKDGTMEWIKERLAEAKKKNITVLAMMHHGIMEHYTGQETVDPGYVTDNWESNADALADAGLRVMFTGHYHANDITMRTKGNNVLFDIETGSLVSPPSPFRTISMDPNTMHIDTKHITSIDATFPAGLDFVTYSNMFLSGHLDGIFTYMLTSPPYNVPSEYITGIAPLFRNAFMAHYAGDEHITPEEQAKDDYVALIAPELGVVLHNLWTDLPPADNQYSIVMRKKLK
ncbi:MAG TPA: metallophosphoesterase [Prolixibacteraceae bacterium]|jgi:predicted MPP superfamily phosphohydrolase